MEWKTSREYKAWLQYDRIVDPLLRERYVKQFGQVALRGEGEVFDSVRSELLEGLFGLLGQQPVCSDSSSNAGLVVSLKGQKEADALLDAEEALDDEGFLLKWQEQRLYLVSPTTRGLLYGVFHLLRQLVLNRDLNDLACREQPVNGLRMINHWDNFDGTIERGYAGRSIFWEGNALTNDLDRLRDYARLLASIGINGISINNVNVHQEETHFIGKRLGLVKTVASIFRAYGIKVFLSVNYASPLTLKELDTADPLDATVGQWWKDRAAAIYEEIPDFGGFIVKADSEGRPGPFTYNRTHAEGANMLADALAPFGGLVIWRCFVYNCQQDWRDLKTDRARAAYDHFKPQDGDFRDNVLVQIKNGPMDFQVREPVSPLFGALEKTNQLIEFQITQEYTGQQRHVCYLVPQWKEILDFDTHANGPGSTVKRIVDGSLFPQKYSGFASVVNVGRDSNWTGHTLAQANLYGYGRLAWNSDLTTETITEEWIVSTFGSDTEVTNTITHILHGSWPAYEKYTSPLGIGWMVNPNHHYGPSVDGYEYSRWGTYHRADHFGIGVDRTMKWGTGFVGQYHPPVAAMYETMAECPEELLLFFHRVPFTHRLGDGRTLIQFIYDTHFEGVHDVEGFITQWTSLKDRLDTATYDSVLERLQGQLEHAKEWRDVVNSYFYRLTRVGDEKGRTIYA